MTRAPPERSAHIGFGTRIKIVQEGGKVHLVFECEKVDRVRTHAIASTERGASQDLYATPMWHM